MLAEITDSFKSGLAYLLKFSKFTGFANLVGNGNKAGSGGI